MSKLRRDGSAHGRLWIAILLLILGVAAVAVVGSSGRSNGGRDVTAKRTPSLQSAFDAARYYLDSEEGLSKSAVLQRVSANGGQSYSEAEATYAVNHVGADWKAEAVEDARRRNRDEPLSRKRLFEYLTVADGFSTAEATYAVSRALDWRAQAVRSAKSRLDEDALSKSQLIKELKLGDFTDAEVRYALEKVY